MNLTASSNCWESYLKSTWINETTFYNGVNRGKIHQKRKKKCLIDWKKWKICKVHRNSHWRCSVTKGVPWKLHKIDRKTTVPELLFNKFSDWGLQLYHKRDPGTSIFLWILRNVKEHLFYTPPSDGLPLDDCLSDYWPGQSPPRIITPWEYLPGCCPNFGFRFSQK